MRGKSFQKLGFWGIVFVCPRRNGDQKDKNYKIQGRSDKIISVGARNLKKI